MKRDTKQFRDFCHSKDLGIDERSEFKKFLEERKRSGEGGTANERGDFTWQELEEKYHEFADVG
jgi:hypothetical protein